MSDTYSCSDDNVNIGLPFIYIGEKVHYFSGMNGHCFSISVKEYKLVV